MSSALRVHLALSFALLVAACGAPEPAPGDDAGRDAGRAGLDAGRAEPCPMPGAVETVACGACGSVERFCTAAGVWAYGACMAEGACVTGATQEQPCGRCGTRVATCSVECAWDTSGACEGEGSCTPGERTRSAEGCPAGSTREVVCSAACEPEPEGECEGDACAMPGAVETLPCGMCGSRERFCLATRVWEYGACAGERTCMPGVTRSASCGMCGTRMERCDATCTWIADACSGEGVCAPGAMMRTGEGCAAGATRLLRCADTCAFVEVEPCGAPPTDAGRPRDGGRDAGRDAGRPADAGPPPVTIGSIQRGEIEVGTLVTVRGVVVTAIRADTIWVQDPTGGSTYAGIKVYVGGPHGAVRSDRVDVTGTVHEYFGDTEISGASVVVTGRATPIAALPLTIAQASMEPYEGMLVRLTDVTSFQSPYDCRADNPLCMDRDLWQVNGASGVLVYAAVYEDADWLARVGRTSITGVMTWRFDRRRIQPRIAADLP